MTFPSPPHLVLTGLHQWTVSRRVVITSEPRCLRIRGVFLILPFSPHILFHFLSLPPSPRPLPLLLSYK